MRELHLVRHARSQPIPGTSAHTWPLTPEGEGQAAELARHLHHRGVTQVVTSTEPKAVTTGRVIAEHLRVPLTPRENLHEQRRDHAPFYPTEAEFRAAVRALFERPDERVFGEESANEAHARFHAAVTHVMTETTGSIVIVAHGTVNSLLVARANHLDAVTFWQSLAMPDLVTLRWPGLHLGEHFTPSSATRAPG